MGWLPRGHVAIDFSSTPCRNALVLSFLPDMLLSVWGHTQQYLISDSCETQPQPSDESCCKHEINFQTVESLLTLPSAADRRCGHILLHETCPTNSSVVFEQELGHGPQALKGRLQSQILNRDPAAGAMTCCNVLIMLLKSSRR